MRMCFLCKSRVHSCQQESQEEEQQKAASHGRWKVVLHYLVKLNLINVLYLSLQVC